MNSTSPAQTYLQLSRDLVDKVEAQLPQIQQAADWFAQRILAGRMVQVFGSGHSRIMVEEMWPRYGSFPGFNPIVELSLSFHNLVVGANGQRQAMFLENVSGLAERILRNFALRPTDAALVISSSGCNLVPIEMAAGFKARGLKVVAIISRRHSEASPSKHPDGKRLQDFADLVLDTGAPVGDAMVKIPGLDTPVAPGSTIGGCLLTNTAGYVTTRQAKLTVGNPIALVEDSFISHPGAGVGGAGVSAVQTTLGLTTQGNGGTAALGNGFSVADDFTVTDATGWQVDEAVFSLYLTGGSITTPPAFTCNIQIWNGPPNVTGSAVIWGDTTTNRTTTVTWIGYRTNDTTIATDGTRSLYNISCKGLGIALPQGTYWVEYRGGHTSGVYMVPRVVIGSAATGNAIRILSSAWTAWVDGGTAKAPQGLPFQVKGWVK